jgi:Uma2 family endonuclease
MTNAALNNDHLFTYGDYLKWPEDERWELIDGIAYNMTPAPSTLHQDILGEIIWQLRTILRGKPCRAFVAPFDVRLSKQGWKDQEVTTVVQPDIVVICDPSKIDKRGGVGAPEFIIEIISPSTAAKDQIVKTALYEKHGVREYWILHPFDAVLTMRTLDSTGHFKAPRIVELTDKVNVSALPGLEIDLEPIGLLCHADDPPRSPSPAQQSTEDSQ